MLMIPEFQEISSFKLIEFQPKYTTAETNQGESFDFFDEFTSDETDTITKNKLDNCAIYFVTSENGSIKYFESLSDSVSFSCMMDNHLSTSRSDFMVFNPLLAKTEILPNPFDYNPKNIKPVLVEKNNHLEQMEKVYVLTISDGTTELFKTMEQANNYILDRAEVEKLQEFPNEGEAILHLEEIEMEEEYRKNQNLKEKNNEIISDLTDGKKKPWIVQDEIGNLHSFENENDVHHFIKTGYRVT